jgi:hypothetical protein
VNSVDASLLSQELAPLNAQIEQTREILDELEGQLRAVEAELETYFAEKERFDLLRKVCDGLERLGDLGAGELFWEGLPETDDPAGHLARIRGRLSAFEEETREAREVRDSLRAMVDQHLEELDYLYDEVDQAHQREERRREEFVVEREISLLPFRRAIMPWTKEGESERRFRRALLLALLWSIFFGLVIPLVNVPIPDRAAVMVEIPERLAMLVKKEPPRPEPMPKRLRKEKDVEPDVEKPGKTEKPEKTAKSKKGTKVAKQQARPAGGGGGGSPDARRKAESTGVLAFKSDFSDLMDEVPVASLGTETRLRQKVPQVAGQARAHRSLVAMQAQSGGSGGISNYGVSRNLGNGKGGGGGSGYGKGGGFGSGNGTGSGFGNGVGFGRVESAVAGLTEEAGRPLSDGPGPGRTDEEIQIVFDRYKATLYRIYNKKLREDPTLRGKLLLRLTIEPDGSVSMCKAESTDLASDELVAQIVARVRRFNFGPKEGVPKITILYPIDFLPAA